MRGRLLLPCALLATVVAAGCKSPYHADRGALLGGLTGAGVGALVGKATGHTAAGAVIGSAVGAITGNAIGTAVDEDIERARIETHVNQQLAAQTTINDVLAMTQAGVNDSVIIAQIHGNGIAHKPSPEEVIALKNQGVSDNVIMAMLQARSAVTVAAPARPVIVEEHYYGGGYSPYWRHYHYGHRHSPRVSWGVSFAN